MVPPHLSFARLKRCVSIERVLAAAGLTRALRRQGNRLVGPCPLHGGDNPTAFVVDLDKDVWYCFTRCKGGGDVVELARRLVGGRYDQAARLLSALTSTPETGPRSSSPPTPAPRRSTPDFRPFTRRLELDPTAPFLRDKGIHPATALRFEAGSYGGSRGFCAGCVAVRLHDPAGRPLGYAARRLDPDQAARHGKWKLPPRLPKRHLLYGYHRCSQRTGETIVVVECPWGVMRLAQLDVPAVALLGTHLSEVQRRLLAGATRLLLLLDGDPAGRDATRRLHEELSPLTSVCWARLPDGLDPDDLQDDELLNLLLS